MEETEEQYVWNVRVPTEIRAQLAEQKHSDEDLAKHAPPENKDSPSSGLIYWHTKEDKCLYIGQKYEGKKHGVGTFLDRHNFLYHGNWVNDEKTGLGIRISQLSGNNKIGTYIKGGWKNDLSHGKVEYIRTDGGKFIGTMVNGEKNGKGLLHGTYGKDRENINIYNGDFVDNLQEGDGVLNHYDGRVYTGKFSTGVYHGKGKLVFPKENGKWFDGEWKYGHMSEGKFSWKDGKTYDGDFNTDDQKHGKGEYDFGDGVIWCGQFVNDKPAGIGDQYTNGEWTRGPCPREHEF